MQTSFKSFLISIYIWTFIIFSIFPLFLLYFIIWILVLPFDPGKTITHYYTALWTRLYLTINPGWKIHIENREKINSRRHYIIVANHQSIIDIALLLQLRLNFKWVSKKELAMFPFVGWVIWMNNHILVRRGDKQSVVQMAEACKTSLSAGISILMFPEGTRTGTGELKEFKDGAFILAKDNNVPILPVVLDGASDALPRKGFWFRVNQTFRVTVLDEISPETINRLDLAQLLDHTRNHMADELKKMRMPRL
jgi:1-acyl-sn-glycerol-3-phosphate acyltransferase